MADEKEKATPIADKIMQELITDVKQYILKKIRAIFIKIKKFKNAWKVSAKNFHQNRKNQRQKNPNPIRQSLNHLQILVMTDVSKP